MIYTNATTRNKQNGTKVKRLPKLFIIKKSIKTTFSLIKHQKQTNDKKLNYKNRFVFEKKSTLNKKQSLNTLKIFQKTCLFFALD